MKVNHLLKSSGLAALAAAIAFSAVPSQAFAADAPGGWGERRAERIERRGDNRAQRIDRNAERRAERIENRGDRRAEAVQRRTNDGPAKVERWGDRRSAQIHRRSERRAENVEQRGDARANRVDRRSEWRADQVRNRTYNDPNRNRTYAYRDRDRDRTWADKREWRDDRIHRDERHDHRKWDRRWRDNNRYDWYDYRSKHRHHYRLGRYYAPYHGYNYRRLSIGFYLDSLFYSSRYWIDDPWQYRLPEVYGPYRWVRYYDDALLVDIYSGEVVDVIHDFFW